MQPMDHFVLTLIIGAVELLFVPWAAWITMKVFELLKDLAVQHSVSSETVKQLEKLDTELSDLRKEVDTGFKEVMTKLNK